MWPSQLERTKLMDLKLQGDHGYRSNWSVDKHWASISVRYCLGSQIGHEAKRCSEREAIHCMVSVSLRQRVQVSDLRWVSHQKIGKRRQRRMKNESHWHEMWSHGSEPDPTPNSLSYKYKRTQSYPFGQKYEVGSIFPSAVDGQRTHHRV